MEQAVSPSKTNKEVVKEEPTQTRLEVVHRPRKPRRRRLPTW